MSDSADEPGSAEAAFEQMSAELARLAQEVRDLNKRLPDVTASVRAFEAHAVETKKSVAAILATPAIAMTAAQHMKAGAQAVAVGAAPHVEALGGIANDLRGAIGLARDRDYQRWVVGGTSAATAAACAFLFLALPTLIHGPRPKTLAEMTPDEQWAASAQYGAAASPMTWSKMARSYNLGLTDADLAAIELCNDGARKLVPPQNCEISAKPPKR